MHKKIHVYDIDGVLVDTSHRYRNKSDGTIDLEYWFQNRTAEKIALDKLLPHAAQYRDDINDPKIFTMLCTSRMVHALDMDFIKYRLGWPDVCIMRPLGNMDADDVLKLRQLKRIFSQRHLKDLPRTLWEDNPRNIDTLRELFTQCIFVPSHITKGN